MTSIRRLALGPFAGLVLMLSGCPASHDVNADAGPATDVPSGGSDAPTTDAPGADAPVRVDAPPSLACDVPSACALRPASCCGSCGAATPTDMIALPVTEVDAYVAAVCAGIGCPECAAMQDPYLIATCEAGECVAIDLHAHAVTECTTTTDCTLSPLECCACGLLSAAEVVAHNPARGSLGSLLCDPDADCPPCVPDYGGLAARCDAGRCVVVAPAP